MAVILKKFHVISTHYNDSVVLNIMKSKDLEISIYGAKGNEPIIYLGSLDTPLKQSIKHVDTSSKDR
ncbi:poly-gamma-glutamate hydrolase family protein [Staphylococcus hominis]|uniref:poly-gamma-glutamate hydrolase family protein n=1 Tax=Staphylococcus hominis TaxID=1290 RepID=UPI0031BAA08C